MRVVAILLFTLVFQVNSIVCSDNNDDDNDDKKHKECGTHPTDFRKLSNTIPAEPDENANIRILYQDGTREPKPVDVKLDMIARGNTIIGYDGKCRDFFPTVHPIFNTEGELCFQHKHDRSTTWPVPYESARRWGLLYPSPSDSPYYEEKLGQSGEESSRRPVGRPKGSFKEIIKRPVGRPKSRGKGISIRPGEDISKRPLGRPKGSGKGKDKQ